MARIAGVDPHQVDPPVANLLDDQQASWGDPLRPYLLYARRPSIVLSVRAMWDALGESGLLEPTLFHYRVRPVTLFQEAPGRHDVFAVLEFYNPDGIWEEAWRVEPQEEPGPVQLHVPLSEGEDDGPSLMRLRLSPFG